MDANQLKLYIEQNIKIQEPGDSRLALELEHFTEAIVSQLINHGRVPTVDQIHSAWERWQLERIHYVNHIKSYTAENEQKLQEFAAKQVMNKEPDLSNNPQLAHEAHLFKQAYAKKLDHLGKQPLPEHVDMAWDAWKRGYRF